MKQLKVTMAFSAIAAALLIGACGGDGSSGVTGSTSTTSTTSSTSGDPVSLIVRALNDPVAFRDGDGPWRLLTPEAYMAGGIKFGKATARVTDPQGRYSFARWDNDTAAIYDLDTEDVTEVDSVDVPARVWRGQPRMDFTERTIGVDSGIVNKIYTNQHSIEQTRGVFPIWSLGTEADFIALSPARGVSPSEMKVITKLGLTDPSQQVLFDFSSSDAKPLRQVELSALGVSPPPTGMLITPRGLSMPLLRITTGFHTMLAPSSADLPAETAYKITSVKGGVAPVQRTTVAGTDLEALNILPEYLPAISSATATRTNIDGRVYSIQFTPVTGASVVILTAGTRNYYVSASRLQNQGGMWTYASPNLQQLGSLAPFAEALSDPMVTRVVIEARIAGVPFPAHSSISSELPGPYPTIPGWGPAILASSSTGYIDAP